MKHVNTKKKRGLFEPLIQSVSIQSAMMVLGPGRSSSDEVENEHPRAEQWVYVISGTGRAVVAGRSLRLKAGSLLWIQKREIHRLTNTGKEPLITINFYSPPAYTSDGDVRRAVATK